MRRDVRTYREHLHVVKPTQEDTEDFELEAVLAVSPVRLDLETGVEARWQHGCSGGTYDELQGQHDPKRLENRYESAEEILLQSQPSPSHVMQQNWHQNDLYRRGVVLQRTESLSPVIEENRHNISDDSSLDASPIPKHLKSDLASSKLVPPPPHSYVSLSPPASSQGNSSRPRSEPSRLMNKSLMSLDEQRIEFELQNRSDVHPDFGITKAQTNSIDPSVATKGIVNVQGLTNSTQVPPKYPIRRESAILSRIGAQESYEALENSQPEDGNRLLETRLPQATSGSSKSLSKTLQHKKQHSPRRKNANFRMYSIDHEYAATPQTEIRGGDQKFVNNEHLKHRLRARWRQATLTHCERLKKRTNDFVPWTAQSIKMTKTGTESFVPLPPAPMPRLVRKSNLTKNKLSPRKQECGSKPTPKLNTKSPRVILKSPRRPGRRKSRSNQTLSPKLSKRNCSSKASSPQRGTELSQTSQLGPASKTGKLISYPTKSELGKNSSEATTQTQHSKKVSNSFPPQVRRWIVVEHVPVSEEDCLRVLRDPNVDPKVAFEGIDDGRISSTPRPKERRSAALWEEQRRVSASFEAIRGILTHRHNAVIRELAADREELEYARAELRKQVLIALENENEKENDTRKNNAVSVKAAPFVCGVTPASYSTNQKVQKSMASLLKTQALPRPPPLKKAEDAWEGSLFKVRLLQGIIDKLQKRIAFRAMSWLARRRVALRRLCIEREFLLKRYDLRRAFTGLVQLHASREWLRMRARERRERLSKGALRTCWQAWRDWTSENLCEQGKIVTAVAFARHKILWRAFAAWRAQPVAIENFETVCRLCATRFHFHHTARRALLGWRAQTIHDKLIRLRFICRASESPVADEAQIPPCWTRQGLQQRISHGMAKARIQLANSLVRSSLDQARGAVSTVCVSVRRQGLLREATDRRKAARDAYLQCAKVARKAYASRRMRQRAIAPYLPARLVNLGIGRLHARSLGEHISALRYFVAGNSLLYRLPSITNEEKFRRRSRTLRSLEPLPFNSKLTDLQQNPSYAWLGASAPPSGLPWRNELPFALYTVRLMRRALRDWQSTAHAIASSRRGEAAQNFLIVRRAWRGLLFNVVLESKRTHLLAWRSVLDRGIQEGNKCVLRRSFSYWRTLTCNRRILRNVFSLSEPARDSISEQFQLLSSMLSRWRDYVDLRREARGAVAAQLHYDTTLLTKVFNLWRLAQGDAKYFRFLQASSHRDAATARAILWHL